MSKVFSGTSGGGCRGAHHLRALRPLGTRRPSDAGRAIALLMTAATLRHDTYNVSSGRPATNREFADALRAITPGLRLDILPGRQDGPGDDPYLDTTWLTHDTGFAPTFDVATAVADYVAWRADNPH
jgi:nucleoside-diphosphate-sugar epimerase